MVKNHLNCLRDTEFWLLIRWTWSTSSLLWDYHLSELIFVLYSSISNKKFQAKILSFCNEYETFLVPQVSSYNKVTLVFVDGIFSASKTAKMIDIKVFIGLLEYSSSQPIHEWSSDRLKNQRLIYFNCSAKMTYK